MFSKGNESLLTSLRSESLLWPKLSSHVKNQQLSVCMEQHAKKSCNLQAPWETDVCRAVESSGAVHGAETQNRRKQGSVQDRALRRSLRSNTWRQIWSQATHTPQWKPLSWLPLWNTLHWLWLFWQNVSGAVLPNDDDLLSRVTPRHHRPMRFEKHYRSEFHADLKLLHLR